MPNSLSSVDFEEGLRHGYVRQSDTARGKSGPQLIVNRDAESMLRAIREELSVAREFIWSVAFVSGGGLFLLKQELKDFIDRGGRGTVVTSDYLGFNSPSVFREMLSLQKMGVDVRIFRSSEFHPKGYVFRRGGFTTAIIGSSNLTRAAFVKTHEWNLRVTSASRSDLTQQIDSVVDDQVSQSDSLTSEWIARYEAVYRAPEKRPILRPTRSPAEEAVLASPTFHSFTIQPNAMQRRALAEIQAVRDAGQTRALVISATGTGKTILSALDVREVNPKRFLFVVHREQILDKAMDEYAKVLGVSTSEFGKLAGGVADTDRRFVFANVSTLSRPDRLQQFNPRDFDYVLIDEVHRAGAESYKRVIDYFEPEFLLGMTATPERTDGFNIFEMFDFNVAYEIRLGEALEEGMLTPFHYFGIADYEFEDGHTTDDVTTLSRLKSPERVRHILGVLETYGIAGQPVRGLIFCGRNEEASSLSQALNQATVHGRQLRTVALSGENTAIEREDAVRELEEGRIDYILTVDIFNEGIDIPSINQVVMLRRTQSAIVFVQQLGRGLRKLENKEFTVVIDFIGNYSNNYLIPVALLGDNSHSKESVRQKLISAEEIGVIAGVSSVRFDRIARERVLSAIATTRFDEIRKLRAAVEQMRNRVGRNPSLHDFYRFNAVDPVVLATRNDNYPKLLNQLLKTGTVLEQAADRYLTFLSHEVLTSKRLQDLELLRMLLAQESVSFTEIRERFAELGLDASSDAVQSAVGVLTLAFNSSAAEIKKYVHSVATADAEHVVARPEFLELYRTADQFKAAVDDLIFTGTELIADRYDPSRPFTPGKLYGRKDACRSLLWPKNIQSTIYGYKVDKETQTCPIFVTLHKSEDVSASTAYEDALLSPTTMLWFTRNRRTLRSDEVAAIVSNSVDLHVFAQKDDAEGSDFYYLGQAVAEEAQETTMLNDKGQELPVVKMLLHFDEPIDAAIFDYFQPALTV